MNRGMLTELANQIGSDKGTNIVPFHNYCSAYEPHFEKIRDKPLRILEIGVNEGPSLRLWNEYFSQATIYGVDINLARVKPENVKSPRIHLMQADQSNRKALHDVIEKTGGSFDIIIDDGGHLMQQQQLSMGVLFPHLVSGGIYAIEDLHTSWYPIGLAIYGNQIIDIDVQRSNTTLKVIDRFQTSGFFWSSFLEKSENLYLTNHLKSCELFDERLAIFFKV